jgi:hypothetical protein
VTRLSDGKLLASGDAEGNATPLFAADCKRLALNFAKAKGSSAVIAELQDGSVRDPAAQLTWPSTFAWDGRKLRVAALLDEGAALLRLEGVDEVSKSADARDYLSWAQGAPLELAKAGYGDSFKLGGPDRLHGQVVCAPASPGSTEQRCFVYVIDGPAGGTFIRRAEAGDRVLALTRGSSSAYKAVANEGGATDILQVSAGPKIAAADGSGALVANSVYTRYFLSGWSGAYGSLTVAAWALWDDKMPFPDEPLFPVAMKREAFKCGDDLIEMIQTSESENEGRWYWTQKGRPTPLYEGDWSRDLKVLWNKDCSAAAIDVPWGSDVEDVAIYDRQRGELKGKGVTVALPVPPKGELSHNYVSAVRWLNGDDLEVRSRGDIVVPDHPAVSYDEAWILSRNKVAKKK